VETTDDEFKVKLDLNAINPDEVQLSCAYGLLILTAVEPEDTEIGSGSEELIAETDEANPDLEQLESYLPFHYQITLPTNIDPTAVTIAFVEDMLEIQLIKLKEVPLAIAS
jgi:HSP20 family molecular chaperone IbpA